MRNAKSIFALMLALVLALGGVTVAMAEGSEAEQVELTVWMWADQAFDPMNELYMEKYPNVKVTNVTVETADYITKLQVGMSAGTDLPDIGALEIDWRGRMYDLGCWFDLEKEFGFDKSVLFDYAQTLGTNSKGEFVSIQWDCDMAGMAYKKELTEQYLGTSDPDELYAMMPDWDSFLAKGIEVKEASGGKTFMLPGMGDLYIMLLNQDQTPFVSDGVANLTQGFGSIYEKMAQFRDAGIMDVLNQWTPAWQASFALDEHIFYPCATWAVMGMIDPNDPGVEDRWGLMQTPGGAYTWGGTALAICNRTEHPEEAWNYLQTVLLSEEGWARSKNPIGYFTTVKSAYDDPEYTNWTTKLTGDQNIGELFFKELNPSELDIRPITSWDHIIRESSTLVMDEMMADKSMTAEDGLNRLIEEVGFIASDLEVK